MFSIIAIEEHSFKSFFDLTNFLYSWEEFKSARACHLWGLDGNPLLARG
jgi:hypothetical protein